MPMPTLLFSRPRDQQIVLAYIVPALFGLVCGIVLGISSGIYLVLSLIAVVGGFIAGLEHERVDDGALRGAIGGILFGTGLVLAHAVSGKAKTSIPHPAIVLMLLTTPIGCGLGALGA
ncbi:MAG TPA: hypothetical protein VHE14_00055, partial [Solirubrobacteraceae bacterium]|nr:hypothetical protein [Solirubrobacteraceae bacterium]